MKDLLTGEDRGPDYIRTFGLSVTRRPAVGAQRARTDSIPPQPPMTDDMAGNYLSALAGELDEMRATTRRINRLAARNRPVIGQKGTCLDCGRPQHYTGTEYGWAHDAVIDLMRCAATPELLAEMEKCWRRDGRA